MPSPEQRPNFLLVMCDQLRGDCVSADSRAFPGLRTPHFDRIARRGVLFNRAYTEVPVCVPARMNVLTGLHAHQLGIMDNQPTPPSGVPTIPGLLTDLGYFTAAVGKMHFRPARNHYGFQRMLLSEEIPPYRVDDEYLQYLREKGFGDVLEPHGQRHEQYYQPQISALPSEHTTTSWTAGRTVDLIRENHNRPFFIWSSFIKPHPPFDPPRGYDDLYPPETVPLPVRQESERDPVDNHLLVQNHGKGVDNPDDALTRLIRSRYLGSVAHVDDNVGKILDALEETGQLERTVVVFMADHGDQLGDHYAWGKRTFYQGAARVPFIVSWPGTLPENVQRDHFVTGCDLLPTFLAHATRGARWLRGEPQPAIPWAGADLTPVLRDAGAAWRDRIVGEFSSDRTFKCMLRWDDSGGSWRYSYYANGAREELFNIAADPDELRNVAGTETERCRLARGELAGTYRRAAFRPALNETGDDLLRFPFQRLPLGEVNTQYAIWPRNEP